MSKKGYIFGICTCIVCLALPDARLLIMCFPLQQSCLSFPAVTSSPLLAHHPALLPTSCPDRKWVAPKECCKSAGGQGHTCVHYTGACVSPWSVVEVGHQSRPHKKSLLKQKVFWRWWYTRHVFGQSCVLTVYQLCMYLSSFSPHTHACCVQQLMLLQEKSEYSKRQ